MLTQRLCENNVLTVWALGYRHCQLGCVGSDYQ